MKKRGNQSKQCCSPGLRAKQQNCWTDISREAKRKLRDRTALESATL